MPPFIPFADIPPTPLFFAKRVHKALKTKDGSCKKRARVHKLLITKELSCVAGFWCREETAAYRRKGIFGNFGQVDGLKLRKGTE
jgi:hypothetical protein